MTRQNISSGTKWEPSWMLRAVRVGNIIHV
jgi:hypothetical protein